MLIGLGIRDVVLIEALDLAIGPGLTALTGETGGGKSIILDALGLAQPARRDELYWLGRVTLLTDGDDSPRLSLGFVKLTKSPKAEESSSALENSMHNTRAASRPRRRRRPTSTDCGTATRSIPSCSTASTPIGRRSISSSARAACCG